MGEIMKLFKAFIFTISLFLFGAPHVSASSDARIDKAHFPDNSLREIVSGFDTNNDGVLQAEEAEAVTKIYVYKFKDPEDFNDDYYGEYPVYKKEDFTFDFKGLGYFSNLSELCINLGGGRYSTEGNKEYPVYTSHASSLYKLKKLKKLNIVKTDIKKFNVSKFPKLEKLNLSGFDKMEKISFSKNKNLKKVYMYGCNNLKKIGLGSRLEELWIEQMGLLESIDISKLKKLKMFRVSNSGVGKIITGENNKSIKEFIIDNFYDKYYKKLKELDLHYLTNVEKIVIENLKSIKELNLDGNIKLKSIFIEGCEQLSDLKLDKCKELEYLDIWGACKKLKILNLVSNLALKSLVISHLKIETILLHKDNKIEFLRYQYAGITKFDIKNINKNTLKVLQLEGNKIKELDLNGYTVLETLCIEDNVIVIGWQKPGDKEIAG